LKNFTDLKNPELKIGKDDSNRMKEMLANDVDSKRDPDQPWFVCEKHSVGLSFEFNDFNESMDTVMYYHDFNWEDHGYYIMLNYENFEAEQLNEEFSFICEFTSGRLGNDKQTLDTEYLRRSMCNYVESVLGMYHEDFDYEMTNFFLTIFHKQFIKFVAVKPSKISTKLISIVNLTFTKEEVFHLVMLVNIVKHRLQMTTILKIINKLSNPND